MNTMENTCRQLRRPTRQHTTVLPTMRTVPIAMHTLSFFFLLLFVLPITTHGFSTSHQWRGSSNGVYSHNQRIHQQSPQRVRHNGSMDLSMHMGHSHSHNHDLQSTTHNNNNTPPPNIKRRIQLAVVTSVVAPLLASPFCTTPLGTALMAVASGGTAYAAVPPVWNRLRAWMKGITRHRPRYDAKRNSADRITVLGGIVNLFLSAGKLSIGVACHSSALVADAGHSLSDLFSDIVTLWAVSVGRLPPDEDHPYGHGKFEAVGSLFLSLTLLGTGLGIGVLSNRKLLEIMSFQRHGALTAAAAPLPGVPALLMAALSVLVKEWLFRITKRVGERLQSNVVIANAWHHRSDAFTSILAVASIGLARFVPGLVFVDAVAGLLVGATIGLTGAEILGDSINCLTDRHPEALSQAVKAAAHEHPAVSAVTDIKARPVGSVVSVDIDVDVVRGDTRTMDAAEKEIQDYIERSLPDPIPQVRVHAHSAADTAATPVQTCVQESLQQGNDAAVVHLKTIRQQGHDVEVLLSSTGSDSVELSAWATKLSRSLEALPDVDTARIYLELNTPHLMATTTKQA